MNKEVVLTRSAEKSLERMPPTLRKRTMAVLSSVESGDEFGKPLKARLAGKRSARVGRSYRIVFEERSNDIVVLLIDHRRDAYR